MIMKRELSIGLIGILAAFALAAGAAAQTQNQPLGDYARAVKKNKPAQATSGSKVYDNDNMPTASSLSVVGNPDAEGSDTQKDEGNKAEEKTAEKDSTGPASEADKSDKKPEITPDQPANEREKAISEWKQKLAAQKDKIDLASRELDVVQREYRVKQAEFYANTASRVQNPNGFAADDAKYKQQIADRQKTLNDAKQKLSDLQDEARKAGVPNSALD
jgi:hypothetical protein